MRLWFDSLLCVCVLSQDSDLKANGKATKDNNSKVRNSKNPKITQTDFMRYVFTKSSLVIVDWRWKQKAEQAIPHTILLSNLSQGKNLRASQNLLSQKKKQ